MRCVDTIGDRPVTEPGIDLIDRGRDALDEVFATVFEAEDALVRHNFVSGTHALAVALFGVLRKLAAEGMTLIMVTHEMRFAREVGNKLVFMHQGKVHEAGAPKALFAKPGTPELASFIQTVN